MTRPVQLEIAALGGTGILIPADLPKLASSVARVLDLMKDGAWHTPEQIRLVAGKYGRPAAEGLRRMRELRKLGFEVERKREPGSMRFLYRLKNKQGE